MKLIERVFSEIQINEFQHIRLTRFSLKNGDTIMYKKSIRPSLIKPQSSLSLTLAWNPKPSISNSEEKELIHLVSITNFLVFGV